MERTELMQEAIEETRKAMKDHAINSDEYNKAAEIFEKLCKLAIDEKKIDYDEYFTEQKLEADKEIRLKEMKLKEEQIERDEKYRWLPSGDTIFICAVIGGLTFGTYMIEGKGVLTPKALTHVKTLFRFI